MYTLPNSAPAIPALHQLYSMLIENQYVVQRSTGDGQQWQIDAEFHFREEDPAVLEVRLRPATFRAAWVLAVAVLAASGEAVEEISLHVDASGRAWAPQIAAGLSGPQNPADAYICADVRDFVLRLVAENVRGWTRDSD
jgi:hypothetical protein